MALLDPIHVLRGHFGEVQSLSFFSEELLFTGDSNGELRLWDLTTCRPVLSARLHDPNTGMLHLSYLPACGLLTSQGRDGSVRFWRTGRDGRLDRCEPVYIIRTDSFNFCRCATWAPVSDTCMGADGAADVAQPAAGHSQRLLVACAAHDPADVGIWRPAESTAPAVRLRQSAAEPKHGMCMSLAFVPECPSAQQQQQHLAEQRQPSGEQEKNPMSASTDTANCREGTGGGHEDGGVDGGASASWLPTGARRSASTGTGGSGASTDPRFIVAGYEDGVVVLWDVRNTGRPVGSLRVHSEPVMCMDVHARPPGRRGTVGCAAAAPPEEMREGSSALYDLVSGSADDKISCCVIRPAEAQPVSLGSQMQLREAGTADVAIRGDGKLFACGCWDGRTRLYSLRRREPLAVLKYHRGHVTAVAFSALTQTLATASRDNSIALWSVYSKAPGRQ